jgi:glycosyltransferase involved in cell wall biosynthesis
VILSVLAPVRDEGPSFSDHLRACLQAVANLDIEIVVLDNRSVDGCCHGLPRDVLIVRTERFESPARLWRIGGSLARGEGLVWLPRVLSCEPECLRALVLAARVLNAEESSGPDRGSSRIRFAAARTGPSLFTPQARSRLDRLGRIPALGGLVSAVAARTLPQVIPFCTDQAGTQRRDRGVVAPPPYPAPAVGSAAPRTTASHPVATHTEALRYGAKRLSVIITAHNEGAEVRRTVESVRANTRLDHEIIVVDDGSTDRSCCGLEARDVRVIRHPERVGVAYSRDEGSRAAGGDVFAYLDAHQRVEPGCLDRCAELALTHRAIICPPCRPLNRRYPVGYGASFRLCPKRRFFSARSRIDRPRQEVARISALRSPGYLIPRNVYRRVAWIAGLRGWGATDYSVALKAFFADVDILATNTTGTSHQFRKRIPYATCWEGVWWNHALIARVCFDDRTWSRYWLPEVFGANLPDHALRELDSTAVLAERDAFLGAKVRPDREFWRGLLRIPEPESLL